MVIFCLTNNCWLVYNVFNGIGEGGFMTILEASHTIESLLQSISPQMQNYSYFVQKNPYKTIMEVLRFRLPRGAEKFEAWYSPIQNQSMVELQEHDYDFQIIINDLKKIIHEEI